jgi:chromosome segregation ATPase
MRFAARNFGTAPTSESAAAMPSWLTKQWDKVTLKDVVVGGASIIGSVYVLGVTMNKYSSITGDVETKLGNFKSVLDAEQKALSAERRVINMTLKAAQAKVAAEQKKLASEREAQQKMLASEREALQTTLEAEQKVLTAERAAVKTTLEAEQAKVAAEQKVLTAERAAIQSELTTSRVVVGGTAAVAVGAALAAGASWFRD